MIQLMEKADDDDTRVINFVCDTSADIENLPTQTDDKSLGYGIRSFSHFVLPPHILSAAPCTGLQAPWSMVCCLKRQNTENNVSSRA